MQNPKRLNYIGSKFQLLDWLHDSILAKTGWTDFRGKTVADLFAGTGIVSAFFRSKKARVISNDAELYSAVITEAFTSGRYTETVKEGIAKLNGELGAKMHEEFRGPIARIYSPADGGERMFFTSDNARRIDYLRARIEETQGISASEKNFLLASLLLSADAVSNVPAVYGCYLKNFKAKANKPLLLTPIHTDGFPAVAGSRTTRANVIGLPVEADAVYLDPPYNERQYSKNYFPLNSIALKPEEAEAIPVKGKTGIPEGCFLSPFCRREPEVLAAFREVLKGLRAEWVFLSYNSEATVSREALTKMLEEFGEVSVLEKDYKRFKSFEYNEKGCVVELLFCLKMRGGPGLADPRPE